MSLEYKDSAAAAMIENLTIGFAKMIEIAAEMPVFFTIAVSLLLFGLILALSNQTISRMEDVESTKDDGKALCIFSLCIAGVVFNAPACVCLLD